MRFLKFGARYSVKSPAIAIINSFLLQPTQWNDVYFRYENGTMIGRVNNEIKTRPLTGKFPKPFFS